MDGKYWSGYSEMLYSIGHIIIVITQISVLGSQWWNSSLFIKCMNLMWMFLTEHDHLILVWCPIFLVCFSCLLCPPLRCSRISSAFFHQWFSSFLVASIVLNQSVSQWFPHSPIFLSSLLVCLCVNQWSSFRDPIKAAELSTFDS